MKITPVFFSPEDDLSNKELDFIFRLILPTILHCEFSNSMQFS